MGPRVWLTRPRTEREYDPSSPGLLPSTHELLLQIAPQDTNLLVTEPVFNLPNVQDHYDQIVFEEYEFQSYLRCPGASGGLVAVSLRASLAGSLTPRMRSRYRSRCRALRPRRARLANRACTRMRPHHRFRLLLHACRPGLARTDSHECGATVRPTFPHCSKSSSRTSAGAEPPVP